jgi:hypothetical protein
MIRRLEAQRIHRPGGLGAGRAPRGEAKGLFLEGHGDIGAAGRAALAAMKERTAAAKPSCRREDRLVADVLPGLRGEQRVDARRLAVADRVANTA